MAIAVTSENYLWVLLTDGRKAYLQKIEGSKQYKFFEFKESLDVIEKIIKFISELFACFGVEKRWQQVMLAYTGSNKPVFFSSLTHQRVVTLSALTPKNLFKDRPGVVTYTFTDLELQHSVPQILAGPFCLFSTASEP